MNLKAPGRMRSAILLGIRMMQMANLTIMFAWAQRVDGKLVISDEQWLNRPLAETLKDFIGRSNYEYILSKLASLFRFMHSEPDKVTVTFLVGILRYFRWRKVSNRISSEGS